MRTTNGTNYAYSLVEKETIYRYDAVDRIWYAWSCIPKHIAELKRQGWELVREDEFGAEFKAPEFALKIGRAQKRQRQLTDKQKAALGHHRFKCSETRDNIA